MRQITVNQLGIVIIGRNEGRRLARCLASVQKFQPAVVYVDSGSTDGSQELAHSLGFRPLELDAARPFSAARARNEGFSQLTSEYPQIEYIQFLDADCELDEHWADEGIGEFETDASLAIVCGRLRELAPNSSVYGRLCDMEWDAPPGIADYCGGIFIVRSAAFKAVNGFNETMIAGEDPELCVRLRLKDWRILRVPAAMATHDGAMMHFRQWWKRAVRSGHAYAEGAALHGRGPTRHWVRQCRSNWLWGAIIPAILLTLAIPTKGWSLLGWGLYPLQALRIAQGRRRHFGNPWRDAYLYGAFATIGKLPCAIGQAKYWLNRLTGKQSRLIEYKPATSNT